MSHQTIVAYVLRKIRPMTAEELSAECEISQRQASNCVYYLHQRGEIHVVGWVKSKRGRDAAVWAHGNGVDAPKPEVRRPVAPYLRTRHPMIEQIAALSDDFRNPFRTAMANVAQGERNAV